MASSTNAKDSPVDDDIIGKKVVALEGGIESSESSDSPPPSHNATNLVEKSCKENLEIDIITTSLDLDPNDNLNLQNWSPWKKRSVFLALMSSSVLCDGGMTWGASIFMAQTFEWDISMSLSSTSINYGVLLQGFGGVFAVPFVEAFGRYKYSGYVPLVETSLQ